MSNIAEPLMHRVGTMEHLEMEEGQHSPTDRPMQTSPPRAAAGANPGWAVPNAASVANLLQNSFSSFIEDEAASIRASYLERIRNRLDDTVHAIVSSSPATQEFLLPMSVSETVVQRASSDSGGAPDADASV